MIDRPVIPHGTVVLEGRNLSKVYRESGRELEVLSDVNLRVHAGEMVAIIGASGSGKSTLLQVLGLVDQPTHGSVTVAGTLATSLSESKRSEIRNTRLGFVYQFHHLLPEFTALDNVAMPLIIRRMARGDAREQAREMLAKVGMGKRASHHPGQLSGGERQRVALARALVTRPACVLADEPTGNLDRHTAREVFALLKDINRDFGMAFVLVTHDAELARLADRQLQMTEGVLTVATADAGVVAPAAGLAPLP